jgi:hypothetical protein
MNTRIGLLVVVGLLVASPFIAQQSSLADFEILRARFYKETVGVLGTSRPVIDLTVRNGTEYAISRAYFEGTLRSEGRTIPWLQESFNHGIPGGLEPGETAVWSLAPSAYGPWGATDAPTDAILTVTVTRLNGPNGEELFQQSEETTAASSDAVDAVLGGMGFIAAIVLGLSILLMILWIVLPFIVLAMNNKLKDVVLVQRETNKLLSDLREVAQNLAVASRLRESRDRKSVSGKAPGG